VDGKVQVPTFTVPLSGGWRSQSGTMTVRWRFQVQ